MTLVELMFSLTISAILVGTLGVMAQAVGDYAEFNEGQTTALQQARVALERVNRYVSEAYATENYPGVVVMHETIGSGRYPDTLLIWRPTAGVPANAAGPPLIKELIIICPDPAAPHRLLEITAPTDSRTIQLNDASINTSTGRALVNGVKIANAGVKAVLTHQLRTASPSSGSARAAIRFECELHPTAAELSAFRAGTSSWTSLSWPQNTFGAQFGIRQVWLRSELQLTSLPRAADGTLPADAMTLPFFGSSALFYQLAP
jgi:hypothetical protein